jgi:hypothetical protein
MKTVTLIDTRTAIPGEILGTVISSHWSIASAFKANDEWQKSAALKLDGEEYTVTKIVSLKNRLKDGETVKIDDLWQNPRTLE